MSDVSPPGARGRLDVDVVAKTRGAGGGARTILQSVAFPVEVGEVVALLGPSGCGKTTLLRIVAGLDLDFDGRITLPAGGHVGVVFQEPRLLPWRNVDDNVRLAAPEASETDLAALFSALGLSASRKLMPGELSLGMARRVAVVRAFAIKPDVLLLDEPFASLDAATVDRLVVELAALVDARRTTTLLVTHDPETAARLADQAIMLGGSPASIVGKLKVETPRAERSPEFMRATGERIRALGGS